MSLGPLAPGTGDSLWNVAPSGPLLDEPSTRGSQARAGEATVPAGQAFISNWGRYQSLVLVGRGGMGLVYKAWDPRLKRAVALKFLSGDHPQQIRRFLQEAQAQARVQHEHVCRIYEVEVTQGRPFLSMQLLGGHSLHQAAQELSLEARLEVVLQAAERVHAAHLIGLIHRDVKPANIMVSRTDGGGLHAYVMDFGLVRDLAAPGLTVDGQTLGTPGYMAPEQIRGDAAPDIRSDVYGLGATLYWAVCGRPPHEGDTHTAVMVKALQEEPVAPRLLVELPRDLETIILRCLEADPERRYQTARELAEDLRRYLRGEPVSAVKPSLGYRALKWVRRNRRTAWAAGTSIAALLVASAWTTVATVRSGSRARLAVRFAGQGQILEDRLRLAYAMPPHDLSGVRSQAGAAMVAIGREMGGLGRGPGHLALGRAHLLLGNLAQARAHGEAAWASGYREVEVAALLGTCLALAYQQELQGLSGAARRERARELEDDLRTPAERHLEHTRSHGHEDGDYLEARLDLVAGRLEAARRKAQASRLQRPWHVESWDLEAQTWVEEAVRADLKDRGARGEDAFRRAGEVLAEGLACNRSAVPLLQAEADRRLFLVLFRRDTGRFAEADLAWAEEAGQAVLRLHPGSLEARLALAELLYVRAHRAQTLEQDPGPWLLEARNWVQEVLLADPNHHRALVQHSRIEYLTAAWAMIHDADPGPWVDSGLRSGSRAAGIRTQPSLEQILGDLHYLRGQWQLQHGEAPNAALASAKHHHGRALAQRPYPRFHGALGKDHILEVQALLAQGKPMKPALDQALHHYRAFWEGLPDALSTVQSRAEILVQAVQFLLDEGQDPGPALEEALRAAEAFARREEGAFWGRIDLSIAHRLRAKWRTRNGQDPREALANSRALLAAARALQPGWPGFPMEYANLEVEHLRWLRKLGRQTAGHREQVLRWTRMALEKDPRNIEVLFTQAEGLGLCSGAEDRQTARQLLVQISAQSPLHRPAARRLARELGLED